MTHVDVICREVVDASLKVHRQIGPGLFESVYEAVLAKELTCRGFNVERQKLVDFELDGVTYNEGFRIDLLVGHLVVLELKSVEQIAPVHVKQLVTYLKLMKLPVGFLINFGCATLKEGLQRVVNGYEASEASRLRGR
jgi:GxxExxY protein